MEFIEEGLLILNMCGFSSIPSFFYFSRSVFFFIFFSDLSFPFLFLESSFNLGLGPNLYSARSILASFRVYKPHAHPSNPHRSQIPNHRKSNTKNPKVLMACKLPSISASAVTAAALAAAAASPTLVTPSELHPDLITTDDADQSILESIAQDVVDVVFSSIAYESGDGELLCVLHLNFDIFEAEEMYGPLGTAQVLGTNTTVPNEGQLVNAEEFGTGSEPNEAKDFGDVSDAADFFDCFEGTGIAIKDGFVEAKRRSL